MILQKINVRSNLTNPIMNHITKYTIHNRNVHISVLWCIVGYGTSALWDLWIRSIISLVYWSGTLQYTGCIQMPIPRGRLWEAHLHQLSAYHSLHTFITLVNKQSKHLNPLLLTWFIPIPAWIVNYFPYILSDKITYPVPNFNGATVEVWE